MKKADDVKRHGKHYTPKGLARFLALRISAALADRPQQRLCVLDPACGDGELLIALSNVLREAGWPEPELIGMDLDRVAVDSASERLLSLGIAARIEHADFLAKVPAESWRSVDVVISNPPYVRTQALGSSISQTLSNEFGLKGRVDLTHAFLAMTSRVLAAGGILGLLCSNRFLSTKAGVNVRSLLAKSFGISEIFDLGDTRLFSAAVLPAIVIAEAQGTKRDKTSFYRAYLGDGPPDSCLPDLLHALQEGACGEAQSGGRRVTIERGELAAGDDLSDPWRLTSPESDQVLGLIRSATWRTFGELAKIRVGIKTTADAVFIRDNWTDLDDLQTPESELLLPLLTHDNLSAWQPPQYPSTRVLYPYDLSSARRQLLDMSHFPNARAYFDHFQDRLKSRRYVTDAGRAWFEIWVPQRPALWSGPKIVFPDISELPRFAMDRSGAIVNGDCYWVSVSDLPSEDIAYLMIAVANSALMTRFYDQYFGNKLYSGRRRWITQYVSKFPVPNPDTAGAREAIALSRKLCDSAAHDADLAARLNQAVESSFAAESVELTDTLF